MIGFGPERYFKVIQGGMGVGIFRYDSVRALAQATEELGLEGYVLPTTSLTGIVPLTAIELQRGNEELIAALDRFPIRQMRDQLWRDYVDYGIKQPGKLRLPPQAYRLLTGDPEIAKKIAVEHVVAPYLEVSLALQGHQQPVAVNVLEKIQQTQLDTILGAMMAGKDRLIVVVGAGIPGQFPAMLDNFAQGKPASYKVDVTIDPKDPTDKKARKKIERYEMTRDPKEMLGDYVSELTTRPPFLAIVSSHLLAARLETNASGRIDGYIIEDPSPHINSDPMRRLRLAGGHNAPPREKAVNEFHEPVYGEKDAVDLQIFRDTGKPFWTGGGCASPEKLAEAVAQGAKGVQVASIFEDCEESRLPDEIKREKVRQEYRGELVVRTSDHGSPTGFPFQVAHIKGTLSDPEVYKERDENRRCPLGYLVEFRKDSKGKFGVRCPAWPKEAYVKNGGKLEDTEGRFCLCCGLVTLVEDLQGEPPIVTSGKDFSYIRRLVKNENGSYTAKQALEYMFSISS